MANDIRWKQRFENFEKAFKFYDQTVKKESLSELERAGLIQVFEFTFELGWKTLKDYLEEKNVIAKFPRDTIKEAFQYQIIDNGDTWMDMLAKRNLIAHTYDDYKATLAIRLITGPYYKAIEEVYIKLKAET